ncbi:MAG: transcription repressor NadR [Clostridia bacterium]|nr:transcription repressor NadR [Clostridia bacterium]MBR6567825.1 transcription repressor NadR [Clostridia bacterium]
MKAQERRKSIINLLLSEDRPIPGGELSEKCGVSRQIIVQDISVLKGQGFDILSTHNGYILQKSPFKERVFKLKHTTEETEDELNIIVDLGGTVADVFVWHKVYGKLVAPLNIFSRLQVKQFMEGVRTGKSTELMNITGGYHYHTVRAEKEEILDRIAEVLSEKGYIAPEI